MPGINSKLLSIPITYTKVITEGVKRDPTVINLASGDSEFQTPLPAINYCTQILPDPGENCHDINTPVGKWTHYEKGRGSKRLRRAIADKYHRESGFHVEPDCVLITNGGMNAIFTAFCAMLEPGDEVLIPDPSYIAYDPIANYVLPGVKGVRVPLSVEDDFALTPALLDKYKTSKTKVVVLTSPLNPTGDVLNKTRSKALMHWAIENDVFILHDENHEKEIYDNATHYPIRAFDQTGAHSVCVNSFSRLGMGGWRLGWMLGPPHLMEAAKMVHTYINMSCNTFVQEIGVYVLNHYDQLGYTEIFREYQKKRECLVEALNQINGFSCRLPQGTCYAFPNIRDFYDTHEEEITRVVERQFQRLSSIKSPEAIQSERELAQRSRSFATHKYLLETAKVGVIPGIAYGPKSDDHIRLSFSVKQGAITEAIHRLKNMSISNP